MSNRTEMDTEGMAQTVACYRPIHKLHPSHWHSGRMRANGIDHHYYRTGSTKPPLVLLHPEGPLSWLRTARVLEHDYDVIMVDARRHGLPDGIEAGYSQELLTEHGAGVIRTLGLDRPYHLSFSQGGRTAIHLADAYPDLLRSLIVVGPGRVSKAMDPRGSSAYRA